METTVEQLIAERSYSSLNELEKALVSELCANEQEFNQMKQFFVSMSGISAVESYEPSAGLKSSLDAVFAAKHGGIGARLTPREVAVTPVAKTIPLYRQTWARVAAGIVLFAGVFSIWQLSDSENFQSETKELALAKEESPLVEDETEAIPNQEQVVFGSVAPLKSKPQLRKKEKSEEEIRESEPAVMYDYQKPDSQYLNKSLKTLSVQSFGSADDEAFSKMKNGIDADLYPDGKKDAKLFTAESASAVASSQEDLLSYIVPAF